MARTPLGTMLQEAAAAARESWSRGVDVDTVLEEREERRTTRRELLRDAGAVGAAALGATAFGRFAPAARAAAAPQIVVVGAGLAGLTAAHRLKQAGYLAALHEASDRAGGRCWTRRGAFTDGQIVERGGELIDQGHTAIRQLAQEFGLRLDNLLQAERNGTEPTYYFDDAHYSFEEATSDLHDVWQKIHNDVSEASYPTLFDNFTERGRVLDHLSIIAWINESVSGGIASRLGQLLDVAYNIEYGAESSEQSSLNLLYLIGYQGPGNLRIFGKSNEKYHVAGGNDQIVDGLLDSVGSQITYGSELVEIRRNSDATYTLMFRQGNRTRPVTADRVVFALPFSILRRSVNLSQSGFSSLKRTAIAEQGMGTNSKLHVQFSNRHWESLDCNGETFADTGYQNTWDVTRAQSGRSGILVDYTGARIGASFGSGTPQQRAQEFLGQIEPVLPGISAQWNGRATVDFWKAYPWTRGSYSYWKVGQYTQFAGIEGRPEGNAFFCGEHTSIDFQGYLNGAVETGERAAGEVVDSLS
ncbi:MAG TPA: NAD(P)/FAD-dependent oxidoreductase [Gaiellaceae bacterium]|nr:NAD(P)/FAD-dependent oxidoreductase [Gaiellaceae bacterium]